jgi:O-antigen/teichoic acid export membrane protein
MNQASIRKNFIFLSLYKVFELLLPFLTSPLLARRLGAEAFGIYTYIDAVVSFWVVFAELGVFRYGMREIAKVRHKQNELNETYSSIFIVHFINGMLFTIIYIIYVLCTKNDDFIRLLFLIQTVAIISNAIDNLFLYVGVEDIKAASLRDFFVKIVILCSVYFFVLTPDDLIVYSVLMTGVPVLCKLFLLWYARKYVCFVIPSFSKIKSKIRPMITLTIPALAGVAYTAVDRVFLGWFSNASSVAFYTCATKVLVPRTIISTLGTVLCPRIANEYSRGNMMSARKLMEQSLLVSLILSYGLMAGMAGVAPYFAPWFWGESFSICGDLMIGLSFSIPFWCIGEVIRNQVLLPLGYDRSYTAAFVSGLSVNIVANFFLIPLYGAMGAVFATVLSEIFMGGYQVVSAKNIFDIRKTLVKSIPYFFISLLVYFFMWCIGGSVTKTLGVNLCILTSFGCISYALLIILYETFNNEKIFLDELVKYMKRSR